MTKYNQRVFGCAIVKAINANYNADFSHQPRLLPDGTAYATDKAFKYLVRNYWVKNLKEDHNYTLYFKRLNQELKPYDLDQAYSSKFGAIEKGKDAKISVLKNLLSCLDVRTFGATFANKKSKIALSIHGPLQISHGINRYPESEVITEQIMSPFRDDKGDSMSDATTLGTQHKLAEGHYVHHFSLNPSNLSGHIPQGAEGFPSISSDDIVQIKNGFCRGATYYDSAAKAGIENELMLWVQLKEGSQIVLPSFVQLIDVDKSGIIDLAKVSQLLDRAHIASEIDTIELYYDKNITQVINAPQAAIQHEIS